MKRDFALIRKILLSVEQAPGNTKAFRIEFTDEPQDVVDEHVELLIESGLVHGYPGHMADSSILMFHPVLAKRLTWEGHDFLSSMKDDTIWRKAETTILKPGLSFTFSLLTEWLKAEAKAKLGIP